jgi:hypothetical protein
LYANVSAIFRNAFTVGAEDLGGLALISPGFDWRSARAPFVAGSLVAV